jgi:dephospho-CoA kinase
MYLVGLTGGIASGKSHVANLLGQLGAAVIDADEVAREVVVSGSPGLAQVVDEFGDEVLAQSGELDRGKLGEVVFSEPTKRKQLESILHPLIKERTTELIAEQKADIVIYAVPLLVEAKVDYPFDAVITVEAGVENQMSRLIDSRGLTEADARLRIQSQVGQAEREAVADFVIDSSGSKEQTKQQVSLLWERLVAASKERG